MKLYGVGMDENYWKGKTFKEFEKAWKGKMRSDKIKPAFDDINPKEVKASEPKKVEKPKEEKNK